MTDQAGSSRRAPPDTQPPSPTLSEGGNREAILWPASDDDSSNNPHSDLYSLWVSNSPGLSEPEADEEPLADVPILLNFDLESTYLDLMDWKTPSSFDTQAHDVTQPLWVQMQAVGELDDDLSRLALGLQSPKASTLPPTLGIQNPEAFVPPLAFGSQPPPASFEIAAPQASLSPSALDLHSPSDYFGIPPPQAPISPLALESTLTLPRGTQLPEASISPPISPLALGIDAPQIFFGIQQSAPSFFSESSLPPIPCNLPVAPPLWNLPSVPCTLPMAPPLWFNPPTIPGTLPMAPPLWFNPPTIPCTMTMAPPLWFNPPTIPCTWPTAPPLWNLPSTPCAFPMAPPLWNFVPLPSPAPERRSWSEFLSTPPPARPEQLLLPHSASAGSSSSSHPGSHQPHHFFPDANTAWQQQVPVAHAPVTISTPNASFSPGALPTSRPSWSQAMMVPRRSWTTANQPWMSSDGQEMKLPIPRRPRFLLPSASTATVTMPAPSAPPLANFRSYVGNMPSWNARGDVPDTNHQRIQTGESSRPRKKSKLALDLSTSEASPWSHNGTTEVASIATEMFAFEPALNRDGRARPRPGTATDFQSLFARYKREKVKERIKILQRLVPNGDWADTAILFEQTHTYIRFLENQVKLLQSSVDWQLAVPSVSSKDLSHSQQ